MSRPTQPHRREGLTKQERRNLALCGKHHGTQELALALVYQAAWEAQGDVREGREQFAAQLLARDAHAAMMNRDAAFFRRLADALDEVKKRHLGDGLKPANRLAVDILDLWESGKRTTAAFKKSLRTIGHDVDDLSTWKNIRENIKTLCPKVQKSKGGRPATKPGR